MERFITITSTTTGETMTVSTWDIADRLPSWYPDAPSEVSAGIRGFADIINGSRYPGTSELEALLGVSWAWAEPLDMRAAAEHLGVKYETVCRYRSVNPSFPAPDVTVGQSPAWYAPTLDAWQAARPGRGVGGGRPRKRG